MCEISEESNNNNTQNHDTTVSTAECDDNASHNMSTMSIDNAEQQPDLIREVLALKLSSSDDDDSDVRLLESSEASTMLQTLVDDDKNCHLNGRKFGHKIKKSEYFIKVNDDSSRMIRKRKRRGIFTKSSCISQ